MKKFAVKVKNNVDIKHIIIAKTIQKNVKYF